MICLFDRLCLGWSTNRAVSLASTTVDASTLVDHVRCTFADSLNWAAFHASTTTYALITDFISHCLSSFLQ